MHGSNGFYGLLDPFIADSMDYRPPYIGGRPYSHSSENSYTEEVAGSSPVPPTNRKRIAWHTYQIHWLLVNCLLILRFMYEEK